MKPLIITILIFYSVTGFCFTELCVVGDTGTGSEAQYKVAEAMHKAGCKDILHTGDVFYERGVQSETDYQWKTKFEDPFSNLILSGTQFYMSMGNHDHSAGSASKINEVHKAYANNHPYYYFPNLYYGFKINNNCFWAVDTDSFSSSQAKEVSKLIDGETNCEWKIVFGHHPVVSSGQHGDAKPRSYIKKNLEPILLNGIDIYFSGHDHNLADEGLIQRGNQKYRQIVSGAGAKLRPVKTCQQTGCEFSTSQPGFVKATFNKNQILLDFMDTDLNILHTTTHYK